MFRELLLNDYSQYIELLKQLNKLDRETDKHKFWNTYNKIRNTGGMVFVYDLNGEIIGTLRIQNEVKFFDNVCHIEDVVVKEEYRGKGYGGVMLQEVMNKLPNCYKVILQCKPELKNFYERCGFEFEGFHMCKRK